MVWTSKMPLLTIMLVTGTCTAGRPAQSSPTLSIPTEGLGLGLERGAQRLSHNLKQLGLYAPNSYCWPKTSAETPIRVREGVRSARPPGGKNIWARRCSGHRDRAASWTSRVRLGVQARRNFSAGEFTVSRKYQRVHPICH